MRLLYVPVARGSLRIQYRKTKNIIKDCLKKTPEHGPGALTKQIKKTSDYFFVESIIFLVESIIFLVLSIIVLEESGVTVVVLSVFTVVVESVVVVDDPDPQEAKMLTANTVNSFLILIRLKW
jgi:hypothetical protein